MTQLLLATFATIPSSADSLAAGWSAGPSAWQMLKVLLVLALVLGLIWVVLSGLRKISGKGMGGLRGVEIVGGLPLGPRRQLLFVKVGSTVRIIGATDHHLSDLGTVSDPADVQAMTASVSNQPLAFGDLIKKALGTKGGAS